MATISQLEINGTTYDILDANTKTRVDQLEQAVTSLQSSVDPLTITPKSGYAVTVDKYTRVGALMFVRMSVSRNVVTEAQTNMQPFDVRGAREGIICGNNFGSGIVWNGQNAYIRPLIRIDANYVNTITGVFII